MKILMVAVLNNGGHHIAYYETLAKYCILRGHEVISVLPQKQDSIPGKQVILDDIVWCGTTFENHKKWADCVNHVIHEEKPDCVHYQYGDVFIRYFGYGLENLKEFNVVLTFHQIREGTSALNKILRKISLRRICSMITTAVVHTKYQLRGLNNIRIDNCTHIEYPCFEARLITNDQISIKEHNTKILMILGALRGDKGLDIFLEALQYVKNPFRVLIAGKEDTFDQKYICEHATKYLDRMEIVNKYFTDEEFIEYSSKGDILVLPYRRSFEGASGPLGVCTCLNKEIIGPSHGSVADIIRTNKLGRIFETENVHSLAEAIDQALVNQFEISNEYIAYREALRPIGFAKAYFALYNKESNCLNIDK